MTRPHVSDDLTQIVEEIHYEQKGRKPARFEEALETVVELANERPRQEGWYPGKFAEQAVDRLVGQQSSDQPGDTEAEANRLPHLSQVRLNPDTQAVFKQALDDDYTLTIPEAEQMALDISPGDIMQVITYPSESTHGEIIE
jgi:hypothetical protein